MPVAVSALLIAGTGTTTGVTIRLTLWVWLLPVPRSVKVMVPE